MFTSFNSTAIYTAHTLEEQACMRQFLDQEGIEYSVSAVDTNAPKGFYPVLSPELLFTQTIDYIFYVYNKDFTKADNHIQANRNWNEEEINED